MGDVRNVCSYIEKAARNASQGRAPTRGVPVGRRQLETR